MTRQAETNVDHAWLPAVLPVRSRRLLVSDPALAEVLLDAGAELVKSGADMEIGPPGELNGKARLAASPMGDPNPDAGVLVGRVASRVRSTALVRIESARARRALARVGYRETEVFSWDLGHQLALGKDGDRSFAERLPKRAVVIGRHGQKEPTLLEAAVGDAANVVRRPLRLEWASPRAGPTTAGLDDGLLRVAVGPSRGQLERQAESLAKLSKSELPSEVSERIAWVEAQGRVGLADWSLERRISGGPPPPGFSGRLLGQCVDFLVHLHAVGAAGQSRSILETAQTAAGFLPPADAGTIVSLGKRLEAMLADLPKGFAHGDFFRGNLLVEDGSLVGVVDWDASGPGRLPLIDLLHLRHMNEQRPADLDWGPTLVEHLLPWALNGGDEPGRDYCRRVGVEPLPERLEGLVAAYWLERLAYQLTTYVDRAARPRWLERNMRHVLKALTPRLL